MKITVLCVGKLKEKYLREAIAEYQKRLSAYAKLEMIEIPDEKCPERISQAEKQKVIQTEGAGLLALLPADAFVIALDIRGKNISSEDFAGLFADKMLGGKSHFVFIIGGSLGLSEQVLQRADFKLSFGKMTYPHQLMRLILTEQIYRAFKINAHEPYHK